MFHLKFLKPERHLTPEGHGDACVKLSVLSASLAIFFKLIHYSEFAHFSKPGYDCIFAALPAEV